MVFSVRPSAKIMISQLFFRFFKSYLLLCHVLSYWSSTVFKFGVGTELPKIMLRCYFDIPVRPSAKILTSLLVIIGSVMPQKTPCGLHSNSHAYTSVPHSLVRFNLVEGQKFHSNCMFQVSVGTNLEYLLSPTNQSAKTYRLDWSLFLSFFLFLFHIFDLSGRS